MFGGDKTESSNGKYWITSQTNILLQSGLKKAVMWAKLNEEHRKEFEKEIRERNYQNKSYQQRNLRILQEIHTRIFGRSNTFISRS